jgi:hypothetical protein
MLAITTLSDKTMRVLMSSGRGNGHGVQEGGLLGGSLGAQVWVSAMWRGLVLGDSARGVALPVDGGRESW